MNDQNIVYSQNRQTILQLIEQAHFSNLDDFSLASDISIVQIYRILRGLSPKTNLEVFLKLSQYLQVPLNQLIILFYPKQELSPILLEQLESLKDPEQLKVNSQEIHNEISRLQEQLASETSNLRLALEEEKESHANEISRLQEQLTSEIINLRLALEEALDQKEEALINSQNIQQQLETRREKFNSDIAQMQTSFLEAKEKIKSEYEQALAQEKESLKQNYLELQSQLEQEKDRVKQEVQDATLQTLESLLIQLPTITTTIRQNPDFPSVKLLPLFRPLPQLLKEWEIEPIGFVGAEVFYDSKYHQFLEGTAEEGTRVKIRYIGYQKGERIIYKAKVSLF